MALLTMVLGAAFIPLARGEDPRPGPPVEATDNSPTPFACSVDTLLSGTHCTLEFDSGKTTDLKGTTDRNVKAATALGPKLCAKVARLRDEDTADADLQRYCELSFRSVAAASCSLAGARALFDDAGHFAEGASGCYEALGQILSRTRSMAALTAKCCRCAARACKLTVNQCNDRMIRGAASDETAACARSKCADECEPTPGLTKDPVLTPDDVPLYPDEPPPYWRRRRPVWPWY
jgi:hypothetical protein